MADWNEIVATHGPMVFRLAWQILGQADDAEDIAQEVFLQAYQCRSAKPCACSSALLRRLTSHRSVDRLRQRKTNISLDGLHLFSGEDGPEALAQHNELADRLRAAVAELPPREAEVFCLRYFEDLSYQEIATSLAIQIGAVKTALHKARERLEAALLGRVQGE